MAAALASSPAFAQAGPAPVEVTSPGTPGVVVSGDGASLTITRTGSIEGVHTHGAQLEGADITVRNEGVVSSGSDAIVLQPNTTATIDNLAGAVISTSGANRAGVFVHDGATAVVNNAGLFTASHPNAGQGIWAENSAGALTVNNLAGGEITTVGGLAIRMDSGSGLLTLNNAGVMRNTGAFGGVVHLNGAGGSIINSGRIEGNANSGAAIFANTSGALQIINSGIIDGGAQPFGHGLQLTGGADYVVSNLSGGDIRSVLGNAIQMSTSGRVTLDLQEGSTVSGSIGSPFGTGVRQVFLSGTLNGAYTGGAGVDNVNVYSTASGDFTLNGGDGSSDSVNMEITSDYILASALIGFEVLRKNGAGVLTLSGANTGLGEIFINDGVLSVSSATNLGSSTGSLGLYGGVLATTADITTYRQLRTSTFSGMSGIDVAAGTTFTAAGSLSGDNGLIKSGSGILSLNTTNSGFSGDLFVKGGAIRAGAVGAFGSGTIHLIDPTLIYGATGAYANNILLEVQAPATADPSTLRAEAGVTATLTGAIRQGAGADANQPLVIDGPGRIVLTNTGNLWTGATTINAGATLQGASNTISGSSIVSNGLLHFVQPDSGVFKQNVSGGGRVWVSGLNPGQTLTFSGDLTNANGVRIVDGSAVGITGSVSASGSSAIFASAAGASITNSGSITGGGTIFNSGVRLNAAGTVVNLAGGAIHATVGEGVNAVSSSVFNAHGGVISGALRGVSLAGPGASMDNSGAILGGSLAGLLLNDGGVLINREGGVIAATDGIGVVAGAGALTITNNGLIQGAGDGVLLFAGGVVNNTGAIVGATGVNASGASQATILNSSGSITGSGGRAIALGAMADVVDLQAGSTTFGSVLLGGGGDTLVLAGDLTGSVNAGDGSDVVTLMTGGVVSGAIDGGADVDSFVLAGGGDATFDVARAVNFEHRSMTGTGTWTLTGVDASTAAWTLNAGVLVASGGSAINDAAAVTIAGGATLALRNNETVGALSGSGFVDLGSSRLTLAAAQTTSYGGIISGSGGVTVGSGSGLTLTGANTYTGVTRVDGVLALGAAGVLADGSNLVVSTAGMVDLKGFDETVNFALIEGVLVGAGTLSALNYQLDGGVVSANLGQGMMYVSGFNGRASIVNGAVGVDAISIYDSGILRLGASDRLDDGALVSVGSGSTLDLGAFSDTVGAASLAGTLDGAGALTAGRYQLDGATVNADLGAGTLFNLGGVSTLNGAAAGSEILITAGTLRLGADERLSDAATVSVAAGAALDINGFSEGVLALFGAGDVNVGAGWLTIGGANSGFAGRLSGAGSLVHSGGLFTLMGDHTIASIGNTAGELRFLGATTGDLAVSGGVVTGAGTIGGALTASNGAVVSPGLVDVHSGIGGFSAGGMTLNGSTLAIDVLGRSGDSLVDQLIINGTANLTGGLVAPTFHGAATDFDFSTRYLFLQAGDLVGAFANGADFTAAEQNGLFWRIRYDLVADGAVLELRELVDFDPGVTGTGNQRSIGQAFSRGQLAASDDFAGILGLLAGLDSLDRAAAFDSVGGEALTAMPTSVMSGNAAFLGAVRDGGMSPRTGGGDALSLVGQLGGGGGESATDRLGAVIGAFDPAASVSRGAGGWVSTYASRQTLDGKSGTAGVETKLNGAAVGYGVRQGLMSMGLAAGVTRLEGDVSARRGRYEGDLSHAAGYLAFEDHVWAADVTASLYSGGLDSRRDVVVGAFTGQAQGDTRVQGRSVSASVARRFQVDDDTMVALGVIGTASTAKVDGFTETGAGGLSLQAADLERNWQSLLLNARGRQDYRVNGVRFRVYAGAGVMASTGDRETVGDMRFTGAPTGFGDFSVQGAGLPPLAAITDFGAEVGIAEGATVAAGYRGVFSERLQENQLGATLRVSW